MRLRKAAHTVHRTQAHLVWGTRYRRKVLVPGVQRSLHVKLLEGCKWRPDWEFIAIGMAVDQVHRPMVIPPKYAVSQAVDTLKANTSRALTEIRLFAQSLLGRRGDVEHGLRRLDRGD